MTDSDQTPVARLDSVSKRLATAAGMALALPLGRRLAELLTEIGCDVDDLINDLDAES